MYHLITCVCNIFNKKIFLFSFQVSGEKREEGLIHSLKEGFGYITCADRDTRMYFQFNELLDPHWKISVGEEVEFTVMSDINSLAPTRQSATRIRKLISGTVKFEILIQENLEGEVTLESNSSISASPSFDSSEMATVQPGVISFFVENVKQTINFYPSKDVPTTLPRLGDRVQFNLFVIKRTKERVARNIKILPPIMSSVVPGRQSMVGSGRTFDRGSTCNSTSLIASMMQPLSISTPPTPPVELTTITALETECVKTEEPAESSPPASLVVDDLIDLSDHQTPAPEIKKDPPVETLPPPLESKPLLPERTSPAKQLMNKVPHNGNNNTLSNSRSVPVHQGFIATLKETFGFIETINHDKEIFFHYR